MKHDNVTDAVDLTSDVVDVPVDFAIPVGSRSKMMMPVMENKKWTQHEPHCQGAAS